MNWEAIGAIGETVGAIATVATLVYLALQIRSNSRLLRSQNLHAASAQTHQLLDVQRDPDTIQAVIRSQEGVDLTFEDQAILESYVMTAFANYLDVYQHHKEGLSPQPWDLTRKRIADFFEAIPWSRLWWEEYGCKRYEPDFVSEVDAALNEVGDDSYMKRIMQRSGDDA